MLGLKLLDDAVAGALGVAAHACRTHGVGDVARSAPCLALVVGVCHKNLAVAVALVHHHHHAVLVREIDGTRVVACGVLVVVNHQEILPCVATVARAAEHDVDVAGVLTSVDTSLAECQHNVVLGDYHRGDTVYGIVVGTGGERLRLVEHDNLLVGNNRVDVGTSCKRGAEHAEYGKCFI